MKRRYKQVRKEFKADIANIVESNSAFGMMIVSTYTANQHKRHITQIWALLGHHHKEAHRDYCDKLMGKHLTGTSGIMKSIYFAERSLYDKYVSKLPEVYAMGDALAVAYRVLKRKK